ncbi:hypothetical protein [Streptosporangium sp. NPDC050280]|uniref:hypothetical protein n=1 Tax=unclassified Streptosporangium TaxID=2632669 RepID=UPI00344A6C09
MSDDVFDVRALLPGLDEFPPTLYLSPEVGDPAADLLPLMTHLGLAPLTLTGGGGHTTMSLYKAQGRQWQVSIGARRDVEVRCPGPAGGDLPFLTGVTITDPAPWCGAALEQGRALLFVGPPLPWKRGQVSMPQVLSMLGTRAACAGIVPVRPAHPCDPFQNTAATP